MSVKTLHTLGIIAVTLMASQELAADKVAAAVHILVDGDGNALSALVAGAIGKTDATAATNTSGSGQIDVFAAGVGGTITFGSNYLGSISADPLRNTASGSLPAGVVVDFDATNATFNFDPESKFTGSLITDSNTTVNP